jgi:pimeloyl-ACP methyl ester carboxylesterase
MEEEAVVAFMRAMHLESADVGGWSMGGWVSMKLTLDHPKLVDRLVIYDSAGVYFPADFGSQLFVPSDQAGLAGLMKVLSPRPRTFPAFVARDILRRMAENGWVVTRSVAAMANGRDLLDFRLHEMKQPLLIVWGSEDVLISLEAGRKIHSLVPGSVLNVVEGCGHLAPSECAKPVIAVTDEFLKAEPAMQGGEKTVPGE